MVPCEPLPDLPETLKAREGKEQAGYILFVWGEAVDINSECRIRQQALIDWIRKEK